MAGEPNVGELSEANKMYLFKFKQSKSDERHDSPYSPDQVGCLAACQLVNAIQPGPVTMWQCSGLGFRSVTMVTMTHGPSRVSRSPFMPKGQDVLMTSFMTRCCYKQTVKAACAGEVSMRRPAPRGTFLQSLSTSVRQASARMTSLR